MKNYNKIVEAVNRGIKFALDDYEDQEEIHGQSNSKVKHNHGTKEYVDLMNEVIDLGLPSGTLWCKYNLGVKLNQLSKAKDWYGDYYAWGELESNKPKYDWEHYKFDQNNSNKLTKYNNNDNLTELLPEDDAAYQNKKLYNYKFHIPTKEQFEELLKYTNSYWVKNYDPNKLIHNQKDDGGIKELNGRIFEGKNESQLFIPAAGYIPATCYYNNGLNNASFNCYLWTSNPYLYYHYCASYLYIDSVDIYIDYDTRYFGYSIRPVINL